MANTKNKEASDAPRETENWPAPTTKKPSQKLLMHWSFDGVAEATDGCEIEPDGMCPHGHPSWLLRLGLI